MFRSYSYVMRNDMRTQSKEQQKICTDQKNWDDADNHSKSDCVNNFLELSTFATSNVASAEVPGVKSSLKRKADEQSILDFARTRQESDDTLEYKQSVRHSYDEQWDAMFEALVAYKRQHGDCLVPKRYKADPKLGTWVDTQRISYKKYKKCYENNQSDHLKPMSSSSSRMQSHITYQRIQRLEELGFVWSIRDDWQKHYEELKEYAMEHGHCNVPARYDKNRRLGIWVSAQRQHYKIAMSGDATHCPKSPTISHERIALLNELGFVWKIRCRDSPDDDWNMRLLDLKRYKEQNGHCDVPPTGDRELRSWVDNQRTQYPLYLKYKMDGQEVNRQNFLTDIRVQTLLDLGFNFEYNTVEACNGKQRANPTESTNDDQTNHEKYAMTEI